MFLLRNANNIKTTTTTTTNVTTKLITTTFANNNKSVNKAYTECLKMTAGFLQTPAAPQSNCAPESVNSKLLR